MRVRRVAREPYALTLWTFLQRGESEMFRGFRREDERVDAAYMVTLGAIQGTRPIVARMNALRNRVMSGPVTPQTLEELSQRADDLFAQHAAAMKQRPVS